MEEKRIGSNGNAYPRAATTEMRWFNKKVQVNSNVTGWPSDSDDDILVLCSSSESDDDDATASYSAALCAQAAAKAASEFAHSISKLISIKVAALVAASAAAVAQKASRLAFLSFLSAAATRRKIKKTLEAKKAAKVAANCAASSAADARKASRLASLATLQVYSELPVLMSGWLEKRGTISRGWKRRWLVLNCKGISWSKGPNKPRKGHIEFGEENYVYRLEEGGENEFPFTIFHKELRSLHLRTNLEPIRTGWRNALETVLYKTKNRHPVEFLDSIDVEKEDFLVPEQMGEVISKMKGNFKKEEGKKERNENLLNFVDVEEDVLMPQHIDDVISKMKRENGFIKVEEEKNNLQGRESFIPKGKRTKRRSLQNARKIFANFAKKVNTLHKMYKIIETKKKNREMAENDLLSTPCPPPVEQILLFSPKTNATSTRSSRPSHSPFSHSTRSTVVFCAMEAKHLNTNGAFGVFCRAFLSSKKNDVKASTVYEHGPLPNQSSWMDKIKTVFSNDEFNTNQRRLLPLSDEKRRKAIWTTEEEITSNFAQGSVRGNSEKHWHFEVQGNLTSKSIEIEIVTTVGGGTFGRLSALVVIGRASLPLKDLMGGCVLDRWLSLAPSSGLVRIRAQLWHETLLEQVDLHLEQCYPVPKSETQASILSSLKIFAFPTPEASGGLAPFQISAQNRRATYHSFVLTDLHEAGRITYGHVLQWHRYPSAKRKERVLSLLPKEYKKEGCEIFEPIALVALSRVPLHLETQFHLKHCSEKLRITRMRVVPPIILDRLYHSLISSFNDEGDIEWVRDALRRRGIHKFSEANSLALMSASTARRTLHQPNTNQISRLSEYLPKTDVAYSVLFTQLEPRNIVILFNALLTSQNVVITSKKVQYLTDVAEAALSLLWPLQWIDAYKYIPLLPPSSHGLLEILYSDAPITYFFGVPTKGSVHIPPSDCFIRIDLDTNQVTPENLPENWPILSPEIFSYLHQFVHRETANIKQLLKNGETVRNVNKGKEVERVRWVFLRTIASLLKDYQSFMKIDKDGDKKEKEIFREFEDEFDCSSFLQKFSTDQGSLHFLMSEIVNSQMFCQFIMKQKMKRRNEEGDTGPDFNKITQLNCVPSPGFLGLTEIFPFKEKRNDGKSLFNKGYPLP
eukprot:g5023.t1